MAPCCRGGQVDARVHLPDAACRVLFGPAASRPCAEEVERLGARRALVLSTPGKRALAEQAAATARRALAGILARAVMHVPIEVAPRAARRRGGSTADCYVAIGGGTTIGLAKAHRARDRPADRRDPDHLLGLRGDPGPRHHRGRRQAHRARPELLPRTVIYDPSSRSRCRPRSRAPRASTRSRTASRRSTPRTPTRSPR